MNARGTKVQKIPVFVVLPARALLLDVAGPLEVLRRANSEQAAIQFSTVYIGPDREITTSIGLKITDVSPLPLQLPEGAIVMIPGQADDATIDASSLPSTDMLSTSEQAIVRWLRQMIAPNISLVTICSGALLAARADLLTGYACTTHHCVIPHLIKLAGQAQVHENRLYVEDRDRLTSAGITAGIDMMLHLVAKRTSAAVAVKIARHMVVYQRRAGADPQLSAWGEGRNHLHPAVHRVQDAITANPADSWSLTRLGAIACTSPRNLSRLFNAQTGLRLTDYINGLRMALAKDMIENSRWDMEHIATAVGFASTRQFRRVWNRFHSYSPREQRQKTRDKVI